MARHEQGCETARCFDKLNLTVERGGLSARHSDVHAAVASPSGMVTRNDCAPSETYAIATGPIPLPTVELNAGVTGAIPTFAGTPKPEFVCTATRCADLD
jgi:hypothetical protein